METSQLRNIVRRIPIFHGFSDDQIEKVLSTSSEKEFDEGSAVFQESDESLGIYILLSGLLQVRTPTGGEIATIGEMGVVGEMGVLGNQPRSATIVAGQVGLEALVLSGNDLREVLLSQPTIGVQLLRIFSRRLAENNQN